MIFSVIKPLFPAIVQSLKLPIINRCSLQQIVRVSGRRSCSTMKNVFQGPGLKDFIAPKTNLESIPVTDDTPYMPPNLSGNGQKIFLEIYGCQMNVNDAEIVLAILKAKGYVHTDDVKDADVVLILTCAIREGAEGKIWERLRNLRGLRRKGKTKRSLKIGLLGCMAERLKQQIVEIDQSVDLVAGPDSYKDLPRLLSLASDNETAVNVQLSVDETYADIMPVRISPDAVSAYISIMRGCDNMCTYCIVPFTRGRERSRPLASIIGEVKQLSEQGVVREVTLLGQNVNSYRDVSTRIDNPEPTNLAPGFKTVYKPKLGGLRFAKLLAGVAEVDPNIRVRFTSPHPKDFPDEVLDVISNYPNVCSNLHLPAQSGSDSVLERMRRGYTREAYLELVHKVRERIPKVALSSDFIAGFCGETEAEFEETLSLITTVRYSTAFLFAYSMREKTTAHRRFVDDVPLDVKNRRVFEMVQVFRENARKINDAQIGQVQLILVEGKSKRSDDFMAGRNDGNIKVIMPNNKISASRSARGLANIKSGDFVAVLINAASSQVLKGIPLYHTSIQDFHENSPVQHVYAQKN